MPMHIGNPPSRRGRDITNMHALAASANECMGRCGLALVVDQYVRSAPEADQLIRVESSISALKGPASGRAKHFLLPGAKESGHLSHGSKESPFRACREMKYIGCESASV